MSKTISYSSTYRGYHVNAKKDETKDLYLGVYTEILDSIIDQITELLRRHSRIHVLRFDCHFPSRWKHDRKLENDAISRLCKTIKENLSLKRWGSHKDIACGWVFEIGKMNNRPHFHVYIAFKAATMTLGAITPDGCTGVLGMIQSCWKRIAGGSTWMVETHTVNRSNNAEISDCVFHLSYLGKVNTKIIGMGNHAKNYSSSRLKPPR